jgi:hypothetical protein
VPNVEELNRLTALGLNINAALDVVEGKRNEAFEVARAREKREVDAWCKGTKNIPSALAPLWDTNPTNFYLAVDGALPSDYAPSDFAVIQADVAEVDGKLTWAADRDKDPWHQRYKAKTCGIAYRWLHSRAVTPPLLVECGGKVHVAGGMHRYHLAKHYGASRMPFLVGTTETSAVMALVQSATVMASSL